MTTNDETPKGKLARGLVGGKTAAKVGGEYLRYAAGKPFRSKEKTDAAKREMSEKSALALFDGLCRLKGTALKIAQLLSLELDVFPPEVRAQLERSYSDVPPMNRALARKVVFNAYGAAPEKVFSEFDGAAFAAASLGQVHSARGVDGERYALKVQYPGIRETIRNDVKMIKTMMRPMREYKALAPLIDEIEARFVEETDYLQEAKNVHFFRDSLKMRRVRVPRVQDELTTERVLCLEMMDGAPVNQWLKSNPGAKDRDAVAQTLQDIFVKSLYELRCLHADPNPGNYLIFEDNTIGLVDFGCVKRFRPEFAELCRQLVAVFHDGSNEERLDLMRRLGTIPADADRALEEEVGGHFEKYGAWLQRLFVDEYFDFSREKDFIKEGKAISRAMKNTWRKLNFNPEFVFLDRTRYGLFRLYERLEARVRFRNEYEFGAA